MRGVPVELSTCLMRGAPVELAACLMRGAPVIITRWVATTTRWGRHEISMRLSARSMLVSGIIHGVWVLKCIAPMLVIATIPVLVVVVVLPWEEIPILIVTIWPKVSMLVMIVVLSLGGVPVLISIKWVAR